MATPIEAPKVEIKADFSFPGMELFPADQATALSKSIQQAMGMQPYAVIKICEEKTSEWEDGRPNSTQISQVEQIVKARGCEMIALETAKMLGKELATEEVLTIVTDARLVYKDIPREVYKYIRMPEWES